MKLRIFYFNRFDNISKLLIIYVKYPLYMAIAESKIEIVKLLLSFENIDINCKNVLRCYIIFIIFLI